MTVNEALEGLLHRFGKIAAGTLPDRPEARFKTYAISNFRGGIGKTTLAFNLAWQLSRENPLLLMDLCPQRNFTSLLIGDDIDDPEIDLYDALLPSIMPGADVPDPDDLVYRVSKYCDSFKNGKKTWLVPGSNELFLFPSPLYTQLSLARSQAPGRGPELMRRILESVETIVGTLSKDLGTTKTILDTSPFFGGATHLGWIAAEALIIPVRVDQQSIQALALTMKMLRDEAGDFMRLNKEAGRSSRPVIHAIAMTHCGWSREKELTPDRSTQSFLTQVLDLVIKNGDLFSSEDPADCVFLLDDFHSAGRISGAKRIPLAKLENGQMFTIEGRRLEVNESISRYKNEMAGLAAVM